MKSFPSPCSPRHHCNISRAGGAFLGADAAFCHAPTSPVYTFASDSSALLRCSRQCSHLNSGETTLRPTVNFTAIAAIFALGFSSASPAQMQMPACHAMPSNTDIAAPETLPPPQKLTGIGNLHFPISSKNPETQVWFDQGMNLVFDFWDYEANRAFEQAIRTDANCAICHWALSESLGIHNKEVEGYAHDELMKAVSLRSHADKREKMYIDSAQAEAGTYLGKSGSATSSSDDRGKDILRQIVRKYPKDIPGRLLLAEAVQDGYDRDTGKARPGTAEMITLLQGILKEKPDDSAANHLWIHAVEASPHPEQALHSAQILADLTPNSGHMTHMPGHIFYRVGDYQRAQVSFDLSESVDETYMKTQHVAADDDWNYVHNLMYSIANLLEQGRMTQAAQVSAHLVEARGARASTLYPWSTRDAITRLNPLLPIALRTGDGLTIESMLAKTDPGAAFPNLSALAASLNAFARGMMSIDRNDLDTARKASSELDAQLWRLSQQLDNQNALDKKKTPDTPAKPANQKQPTDPSLEAMLKNLSILSLELRAAILVPGGKISEAETLFSQARREETDLGYREPPAFIQPVAELEAKFLTSANQKIEAEKAWKQALEDRPKSGFPLFGLGQLAEQSGDTAKTTAAYNEFLTAWKTADPQMPEIQHAQQWVIAHPNQSLASK
jgi:tetratricopeptide (TPR) repeat protein